MNNHQIFYQIKFENVKKGKILKIKIVRFDLIFLFVLYYEIFYILIIFAFSINSLSFIRRGSAFVEPFCVYVFFINNWFFYKMIVHSHISWSSFDFILLYLVWFNFKSRFFIKRFYLDRYFMISIVFFVFI